MAPDWGHMQRGQRPLREEARAKHPKLSIKLSSQKKDRHSQAGWALVSSLLVNQEALHQRSSFFIWGHLKCPLWAVWNMHINFSPWTGHGPISKIPAIKETNSLFSHQIWPSSCPKFQAMQFPAQEHSVAPGEQGRQGSNLPEKQGILLWTQPSGLLCHPRVIILHISSWVSLRVAFHYISGTGVIPDFKENFWSWGGQGKLDIERLLIKMQH